MQRQAIVIGLGQFGMSVARALAERDVEVLAIDLLEERVRAAAAHVAEAARLDATDTEALRQTSPDRRDICLCAIGDDAREASIICTALLRQMGATRVIARANDEVHARILTLVGAHQVINPEREFGERFVNHLLHAGIRGEMRIGEGVLISEVDAPGAFVGHSLGQLQLPRRFGVTVVAIRKGASDTIVLPEADTVLQSGDVLVLVGRQGSVPSMMEKV